MAETDTIERPKSRKVQVANLPPATAAAASPGCRTS